jgi:hypothetical protein
MNECAFRLNHDDLNHRAGEFLRGLQAGDQAALRRFHIWEPGTRRFTLTAVRRVIALEHGLPTWRRLSGHVIALERARADMAGAAPDADMPTLHIRCGSDIVTRLSQAGFVGDFLEYSDPLCQGPVTDSPDRLEQRARFITRAYGATSGFTLEDCQNRLMLAEQRLDAAIAYDRVVLWFEHDSYDQLVLARCLARFADTAPRRLQLICVDAFPGSRRFIGLGQLPPEALRLLWSRRLPVTPAQRALGVAILNALRDQDPSALARLARGGTPALRQAAPALLRHLRELPDRRDGLGLTERLVLEAAAEADHTIGQVFDLLTWQRDPLPWLGDVMLLAIVEAIAQAKTPALTIEPEDPAAPWPRRRLCLTEAGHAVLAGTCDYLSLGPPERWVGGVLVRADGPVWRWDESASRPVRLG